MSGFQIVYLDYHRGRELSELARIIQRSRGRRIAKRFHRRVRWWIELSFSIERWWNPERFDRWNAKQLKGFRR